MSRPLVMFSNAQQYAPVPGSVPSSLDEQPVPVRGGDSDDDEEVSVFGEVCAICKVLQSNLFLSSLLVFVPLGIVAGALKWSDTVIFTLNFFAIVPMAWLIGKSTEDLAEATGQIMGGLINATFGNIVEMLLCVAGISQGALQVVRCTLVGSILSNLLLVLGTAFIYGGYYFPEQTYKKGGALVHSSLLMFSVLAMALPTMLFISLQHDLYLVQVSRWESVLMLALYFQYLYFQMFSHSSMFEDDGEEDDEDGADMGPWTAGVLLAVLTVLTSICCEYLIGSIETTVVSWGVSTEFIGIILLPIIGNAAEHYTAITVAGKNKMDLSLGVAVGSAVQMALLVTPFTVIVGWVLGQPVHLNFYAFQIAVLAVAVLLTTSILHDGTSNWLVGSLLVYAYIIIAMMYFVVDGAST
eukprot:CAMPEP_0204269446 /NCGR_PEP_ID=MMETSP0468-20130131/16164_1 /ASSEMBLY_ACC=CAM_ASM_000383 /TAXON_ID=2969 /ORGANISM="Oxyrrhis marina" /LENGTH=410 /DNA_ID=CAMNT_0051244835 /DNA_START=35 /DNA_END=1267 /DNA_ORIENTATION=+